MRASTVLQVWIHRGAYSCALELHCGNDRAQYVGYCRSLAQMLLDAGVQPLVVFDGRSLGAKSETARRRAESRAQSVASMDVEIEAMRELELQAEQHPAGAKDPNLLHAIGAARARVETAAQRTIKVTAAMVEKVMAALRAMGVEVLRAPYEADAQLAYLARNGHVSAVLTEDSDLIAYACPCVLLKLDRHTGTAQRMLWQDVQKVRSGDASLKAYTETMFLELCILCGCDYLDSIEKIGPKTAVKLMSKLKDGKRVIRHLRVHGKKGAPPPPPPPPPSPPPPSPPPPLVLKPEVYVYLPSPPPPPTPPPRCSGTQVAFEKHI